MPRTVDGMASSSAVTPARSTGKRPESRSRTSNGPHIQVKWRPAAAAGRAPDLVDAQSVLMMAVAKRLLPRAIDRNRFRRVVREAWRARARVLLAQAPESLPALTLPQSVFVRLMRKSAEWRSLPDRQLKQAWRREVDQLLDGVPGSVGGAR